MWNKTSNLNNRRTIIFGIVAFTLGELGIYMGLMLEHEGDRSDSLLIYTAVGAILVVVGSLAIRAWLINRTLKRLKGENWYQNRPESAPPVKDEVQDQPENHWSNN